MCSTGQLRHAVVKVGGELFTIVHRAEMLVR